MLQVRPGITCRLHDTGHILGSAIIELWSTEPGRTTKGSVFRRHQIKRPADREIVMKGRYEFEDARHALGEARRFVEGHGSGAIQVLRAKARRLRIDSNIGLIIVDYLQRMPALPNQRAPEIRERAECLNSC